MPNFHAVAPYIAISKVHLLNSFADDLDNQTSVINSSDFSIDKQSLSSHDLSQGIFPHQNSFFSREGVPQLVVFAIPLSFFVGYISNIR